MNIEKRSVAAALGSLLKGDERTPMCLAYVIHIVS